jgi:hypothetical protein
LRRDSAYNGFQAAFQNKMKGARSMRRLPLALFALALLYGSQASAGMTGNGSHAATTYYVFCFSTQRLRTATVKTDTVYFSTVFSTVISNLSLTLPNLGTNFTNYLTATFGDGPQSGTCSNSTSMADAANAKKQREAELAGQKWQVVETKWAGAPGTASSVATSPVADANAPTSQPPAAPPGTDTVQAQAKGQIQQAGKKLLNKLFQH